MLNSMWMRDSGQVAMAHLHQCFVRTMCPGTCDQPSWLAEACKFLSLSHGIAGQDMSLILLIVEGLGPLDNTATQARAGALR